MSNADGVIVVSPKEFIIPTPSLTSQPTISGALFLSGAGLYMYNQSTQEKIQGTTVQLPVVTPASGTGKGLILISGVKMYFNDGTTWALVTSA